MNDHLPTPLREALNGSFRLPKPQIVRIGAKTEVRASANDGELTSADLADIDAQFGISQELAQSVDAAMHADKLRNGYDERRERVTSADVREWRARGWL
jgi:hypothetical protein